MKTISNYKEIEIFADSTKLKGHLVIVENAKGIILFSHGSGSSRFSPRNNFVAQYLQKRGFLNDNRVVCGAIAYRTFSDEDVRKIKTIKKYQDEGYTLKKAVEKAEQEINNNMEELKDENL